MPSPNPSIGFLGLGAMGIGMATHLCKSSFPVTAFDINPTVLETLKSAGGTAASSPAEACADKPVVICMVATADHVNAALFAEKTGAVHALAQNATIILHSTIPPTMPAELRRHLDEEFGRGDVVLIDAPVSGGSKRSANGTLSIMVSAQEEAQLEREDVRAVLDCTAASVFTIKGGLGRALSAKALNQVLCGIQIAATSEIMGLAAVLGLDTRRFYEYVVRAEGAGRVGWSWMFEDRVVRMLDPAAPLASMMSIILKDVKIVNVEAERLGVPLRLTKSAQKVFEKAVEMGLERADDSFAVEVYLKAGERDKSDLFKKGAEIKGSEDENLMQQLAIAHGAIHAAGAYEALIFAEALGMCESEEQKRQWFDILASAAAGSTVFIKGMPSMLQSVDRGGEVELLVPVKSGLVESLGETVKRAREKDYLPVLMVGAEEYLREIGEGGLRHRGNRIRLVG